MSYRVTFVFCMLLALAAALETTLTQSFFYTDAYPENGFTQPFLRTKSNILAYSVETPLTYTPVQPPQFLSINLNTHDATRVLNDIMDACGQNFATYMRAYYHASTSTLVYYCTSNNTLLILNEDTYTVQSTIPLEVTEQFNETRFYTEGDSIVILGSGSPFSLNETTAQLIKINLETGKVTRQVTFNNRLAPGEVVTAYASTGVLSFILTTQVNSTDYNTRTTIYSVIMVGNLYNLAKIASFSYFPDGEGQRTNNLFCLGDYLVTNDYENLLFFNIEGKLAYNLTGLSFKTQLYSYLSESLQVPNYALLHGSSELLAYFANTSVIQISPKGQALNYKEIYSADDVQFVLGNQDAHDLLFARGSSIYFTIWDVQDSTTIYTTVYGYSNAYLTKSTYLTFPPLNIFNLTTNTLVANLLVKTVFYFEDTTQVFYYIDFSEQAQDLCTLKFIQPDTLITGEVFSFQEDGLYCDSAKIIHMQPTSNISSPSLTIKYAEYYIIHTERYGLVQFLPPNSEDFGQLIVPNYDDLSLHYISLNLNFDTNENYLTISQYLYDEASEGSFRLKGYYTLNNAPYIESKSGNFIQYSILSSESVAVYNMQNFTLINLAQGVIETYNVPAFLIASVGSFHDLLGQTYLVVNCVTSVGLSLNYIFGPNKEMLLLPNSDEFTTNAGAAGLCTYWVSEAYVSSFGVTKFYNVCDQTESKDKLSIISK